MSWPVNARTSAMMDEAQTLYGATITATQGSPNPGGVAASFGTHDGEGVIDVVGADLDAIVVAMRKVGFAAWHRTVAEGFTPHVHGVAVDEPGLSPSAADQVTDYFEGRNGLATNAPDDGPRDWVGITWEDYLAGNPAPGGTAVFRGEQVGFDDVVVTAGPLDPYADVFAAIDARNDAVTVTLHAGDEFYLYASAMATAPTDIYSLLNWRLNAAGHGTIVLADSFDPDYSYTPPFTWADLGSVVLDSDTFALTATPASASLADPAKLSGDTGAPLLRITCTTGTVILEWACLQVEPPAGLLVKSGSHWSAWFTPALVPHSPAATSNRLTYGWAYIHGRDWDETDRVDAVAAAQADAIADYGMRFDFGAGSPITESSSAFLVQAGTKMQGFAGNDTDALAQPEFDDYGDYPFDPDLQGLASTVVLQSDDTKVFWDEWPDYRTQPTEIIRLAAVGEVELDPVTHVPTYEFAAGDTESIAWKPTTVSIAFFGDGHDDGAFGYGEAGLGAVQIDQALPSQSAVSLPFTDGPGDVVVSAFSDYLTGTTFGPPFVSGVQKTWTEASSSARLWIVSANMAVNVRMPDVRYLVNEWIRSPDALDTSDPEGVLVTWLRQRQRNDGLGNSVIRAKGRSSRQTSLRQRGYR